MQTFCPHPDPQLCARTLDRQRLGKQRIECVQIIRALSSPPGDAGWQNHPVVKMWRGHRGFLARYGMAICDEWIRRGYKDNQWPILFDYYYEHFGGDEDCKPPWWGGDIHHDHRVLLGHKAGGVYVPDGLLEEVTVWN